VLLQRAVPPGAPVEASELLAKLALGELAPAERPYVACNFVASADGKATAGGRSAPLSDDADREVFHLLRGQVDAVMAGTGTLRVERYGRLVRDPLRRQARVQAGLAPDPLAIVVSRSFDVPFDIPLFADADSRVAIYTAAAAQPPVTAAQVRVTELGPGAGDLRQVLGAVRREHGVRSILCEGGPLLFNALLEADLVDELFLTLAPMLAGGAELGLTLGPAPRAPRPMRLVWALEREGVLFLRYRRDRGA
jgi:riboflavin-specific deaminase-like protein